MSEKNTVSVKDPQPSQLFVEFHRTVGTISKDVDRAISRDALEGENKLLEINRTAHKFSILL